MRTGCLAMHINLFKIGGAAVEPSRLRSPCLRLFCAGRFVPLLYGLLGASEEAVAAAAADVLQEVVGKRMEAAAKLAMVQQLALSDRTAAWAASLRPGEEDSPPDLSLKCARLLSTLATGILCCRYQCPLMQLSFGPLQSGSWTMSATRAKTKKDIVLMPA